MEKVGRWEWAILTGLGAGLIPKAPGTAGSLVGLIVGGAIIQLFPNPNSTLLLLGILVTLLGVKLIDRYEAAGGVHDDKRIVIDEIAGVLVGLALFNWERGVWNWVQLLLFFFSFRLFDIWKPSIIGRVDRQVKGGWGVMGDDLLAGVFGAILTGLVVMGIEKGVELGGGLF